MASTSGLSSGIEPVIASEVMRKLMRMAERVARSGATVLITGETGSGKELIARAIHQYSARATKAWVDLNCAALPENLVESELFGYEKGAFSGADTSKPGLFELADKGTLFLDEIGELEPKVQVKLLRVLDGAPYYRLGGSRKISVDVRIIAATNQELEHAVRSGRFRADLFHRLSQFQLKVPPLRERPEDVVAIAQSLLHRHNPDAQFAPDALDLLQGYSWPGNVRELHNVILQAATLAEGVVIGAEELGVAEVPNASTDLPAEIGTGDLDQIERRAIERALEQTNGNQGRAAEVLGISRRTLSRKLKQYKVDRDIRGAVLGRMSPRETQHFRASLEGPVFIRTERGEELEASLVNVSVHGLMVSGIDNPFKYTGPLEVQFSLPDAVSIRAKGHLVWADQQHRAGIHLIEIPADAQRVLTDWLVETQREEGWATTASQSATDS